MSTFIVIPPPRCRWPALPVARRPVTKCVPQLGIAVLNQRATAGLGAARSDLHSA